MDTSHWFTLDVSMSSLCLRQRHTNHGLTKPEPHVLLLLVLRGDDGPELVLHDPGPRPLLHPLLHPRRPDGG